MRASAEFVGSPLPEEWATSPDTHAPQLAAAAAAVNASLSERYRSSRATGAAHDMKGSGVMHPLSSEVVKACLPVGQVKVRLWSAPCLLSALFSNNWIP